MPRILNIQPRAHVEAAVPKPWPESLPAKKPPVGTRNQWHAATPERQEDVGAALRALAQSAENRAAALKQIAEQAVRVIGADGFAIALSHGDAVVCECSVGFAPAVGTAIREGGLSAQCLRSGRPVKCADLQNSEISGQNGVGVRSTLMVPVLQGGHAIGLLAAFSPSQDAFDDDDIAWMTHAADAVSSIELVKEAAQRRVAALLATLPSATYTVAAGIAPDLVEKVRGWMASQNEVRSACATVSLIAAALAGCVLVSPRLIGMPFWLWLSALPLGLAAIGSGHYSRFVASRTDAEMSWRQIAGIAVGYAVVFTLVVILAMMYGDF